MKLSLILTGADRHDDTQRFFDSLLAQVNPSCAVEVVFINQGAFQPPITEMAACGIFCNEIRTGRLPLSKARNIGLAEASGDLIAFPDDDCWYSEQLLAQVMAHLERRPELDAICTNVYDPITQRAYGGRPTGLHCEVNFGNLFELPTSVGIFVRRKAFEAAGFYFDEALGAGTQFGSGEEIDLIYRLLKSGALVEYVGSIQVFHPVPEYQDTDVAKYYRYGLGFGYLNGRIVRGGELRVLRHFGFVFTRSLGGTLMNFHCSMRRRLYWNRLLGIFQGFVRGYRSGKC